MTLDQTKNLISGVLKKWFFNKSVLDKIAVDEQNHLMFDGELVDSEGYFTETDVINLISYLWPSEYTTSNFFSSDYQSIETSDEYIFDSKGDSD